MDWSDPAVGSWDRSSVFVNDRFLVSVSGPTSIYEESAVGSRAYSLRAFVDGQRFDADCGSVNVAPAALTCSAVLNGDEVTVSWNDAGYTRVSVFANAVFAGSVSAGVSSYNEDVRPGTTSYALRAFIGSQRFDATCSPDITVEQVVLTCTQTITADGLLRITWNDVGAASYQVRTDNNTRWLATLSAGATFYETANNGEALTIRYRLTGDQFNIDCV